MKTPRSDVGRSWLDAFEADPRSLAALRVGLGLSVLGMAWGYARELTAFLTDDGVLPRAAVGALPDAPAWSGVHMVGGSFAVQAALLAAMAALAVCLVVGLRTKWVTAGCWFLVCSLEARNPLVLYGPDQVLRLLLFWAMFAPLGAAWSMDARLAADPPPRTLTLGTAGLLVQLASMYMISALSKTASPSWRDGSALQAVLGLAAQENPIGLFLLRFPSLLRAVTQAVPVFELLGPLLFLATGPLRAAAVAAFVCFHLAIAASMRAGGFSPLVCVGLVGLLPAWFWDRLGERRETVAAMPLPSARSATVCGLLLATALAHALWFNLGGGEPAALRWAARNLGLDQWWGMCTTRRELEADGWMSFEATLANGQRADLMTGRPPEARNLWTTGSRYNTMRWQFYLGRVFGQEGLAAYRGYFIRSLCRDWNANRKAGERALSVRAILVPRRPVPGRPAGLLSDAERCPSP